MQGHDAGPAAVGKGRRAGWWAVAALLVVSVFLCYVPALRGELLTWDDRANFVENTAWQGLGPGHLRWMATTFHMGHYQPLTWLSFGLQYALGAGGAAEMHTVNVALHALNAVLFLFLCGGLLRAGLGGVGEGTTLLAAGLAAGVFALHPLRVESVAWVTERRDVLSAAFLLGAGLAYLRSVEVGRARLRSRGWYAACVGLLLLSCLSKAWGMSFFVVLLALDAWPLRRLIVAQEGTTMRTWSWHTVFEKWPMVVIGLGTAWAASRAQRGTFATKTLEQWPVADRLVQAAYGLWFYVRRSVAPISLSPLYELPPHMDVARNVGALFFAAVLLGAVVFCWRRWPAVSVGLFIYIVLISPVLGFVQSGEQLVADRYSYLATMPLAVLLAGGIALIVRRSGVAGAKTSGLIGAAGAVAVASLGLLTYAQAAAWRNSLSLWEHAAEATPTPMVLVYRGDALLQAGKAGDAQAAYERALELNPKDGRARFSCALLLEQQGKTAEAERAYLEAIPNLNTLRYRAHQNLGVLYWQRGLRDEAIRQLELAIAEVQRPDHKRPSGTPFMMLAQMKLELGDPAGAAALLQKAAGYPDTRGAAEGALRELRK